MASLDPWGLSTRRGGVNTLVAFLDSFMCVTNC